MEIFSIGICVIVLIALVFASITDLKKREVPDWLNFAIIFFALGARGLYSIIFWDYHVFLEGIIGFVVFVILAYIMFYAGQWGGGDSKLLMGMGAVFGIKLGVFSLSAFPLIGTFIINLMLFGAIYGLIWSSILAVVKWKEFLMELKKIAENKKLILIEKNF